MYHIERYQRNPVVHFPEREWPNREIEKAPIWCSVDLRDGNQALVEPMVVEEKTEMFNLLLKLGFKEIEIGFPAASQIEFDFLRLLALRKMIPSDVHVQVLTQCREHLIRRTFEAIEGIPNPIVHIYNSTNTLQRDVVFHASREEIKQIAIDGVKTVKACMKEWMARHFKNRDSIVVSIHPHNDRGTGVAATELALLAGADRVEGTLFGNGERTGNVDILTVAYNMYSQGIEPHLNISNEKEIAEVYERCTKMSIPPRHPYAGELVFTAFSGSHQDAINKGLQAMRERNNPYWQVPYLPIDPSDIGRVYQPVVRINSQSGKGGVAFIMDTFYGFRLPKGMHKEFADIIQALSEKQGEIAPEEIYAEFQRAYPDRKEPVHFKKCVISDNGLEEGEFSTRAVCTYTLNGEERQFEGVGNGPIDAVRHGLAEALGLQIRILDYSEHALRQGSNAQAASYIHMLDEKSGRTTYGVGISSNITRASLRGIFSAVNRLFY